MIDKFEITKGKIHPYNCYDPVNIRSVFGSYSQLIASDEEQFDSHDQSQHNDSHEIERYFPFSRLFFYVKNMIGAFYHGYEHVLEVEQTGGDDKIRNCKYDGHNTLLPVLKALSMNEGLADDTAQKEHIDGYVAGVHEKARESLRALDRVKHGPCYQDHEEEYGHRRKNP